MCSYYTYHALYIYPTSYYSCISSHDKTSMRGNILGITLIAMFIGIYFIVGAFISVILIIATIILAERIGKSYTPTEHIHLQKVPPKYHLAYRAYLQSKEWRVFRKIVLKRDRYKCVDCGGTFMNNIGYLVPRGINGSGKIEHNNKYKFAIK